MEESYFSEIFRVLPFPCLVLKPSGDNFLIVDANIVLFKITGTSREVLIGQSVKNAFPDNPKLKLSSGAYQRLKNSLDKVIKTGNRDKIKALRYDQQIRGTETMREKYWNLENIPIRNYKGEVENILLTIENVTEQVLLEKNEKRLNEELTKGKEEYQHFIEKNPDGLYSLDFDGNFLSANEGIARMAEIPREELLKMNFLPFCMPQDRDMILKQFRKALNGTAVKFEAQFISAKGKILILDISLMPAIKDGKIAGVHGIAKDLTSIKKTEKIVVEKKKFLEVNANFISSLLHNRLEDESLREAFGIIGEAVDVDRMYYFETFTDKESQELYLNQRIEWTSTRCTPQIHNPEMQNLPASHVSEIMEPLLQNVPFIGAFSEIKEGDFKQIFIEQEIKSMLLLPIFLDNGLKGFIGFDDCRNEREWSEDEIKFLNSLVQNLTGAMEKREAEAALKEREEEIQRSEKKFRALVQEGSDLIAILDKNGTYTFVSATTTAILGISPEEFLGKNPFDFIHPDDKERVNEEFKKFGEQKQVKISPFRFLNKSREWRWLETTATNLLDDPAVEGIVTNSKDVTTIVDQAKEIEQINERYRLAAAATQDIIYDWNLETDVVIRYHRNQGALEGYSSKEIDQRDFWRTHIHPDELEKLRRKLKRTLTNPNQNFLKTEYRFQRADGSWAFFIDRGYIIRDSDGKALRHVGASSDISSLKAKEEALKISNDRFTMAMEATSEMIWDWDIFSDRISRSKSFMDVYGYGSDESTLRFSFWVSKIVPEDRERVKNSLEGTIQDKHKNKWREEYRFIKADGDIAYVLDRGFIKRDEKGNAVRLVGAVLDVTESRRLIREIKKQNDTLKEIAWEQSHIVRAPLVRIKGLLQLLEMHSFEEMEMDEILQHIHSSADELDEIIRKIVKKTEKIGLQHKEYK